MAFLEIRTSTLINVVIIIFALLLTGFLLLMGITNLINPDVPDAYLAQNTRTCLLICCISVLPLLLAIAAYRGILHRNKSLKG